MSNDSATEPDKNPRSIGVGTSPDGKIAIAIDGTGYVVDKEDAKWIASEIQTLCAEPSNTDYHMLLERIPGIREKTKKTLEQSDYNTVSDIRDASVDELLAVDGLGNVIVARLKDKAHRIGRQ